MRVGDEDRRPAGGGRARRSSPRSGPAPGRTRRGRRRGRARRRAACSGPRAAPPAAAGRDRSKSRRPARWMTWKSRPAPLGEGLERAPVDRAGALAAAHDQQAARVRRDAEPAPRGAAIGGQHRGRYRAPGDQVAPPLPAGDREGEADPPRAPGQQAVGEAEVAVGLGEDERDAGEDRGKPRRPGDEAAAAEHDVGSAAADRPPRGSHRDERLGDRDRGAQRVAPVDPAHLEQVDLIAGRGHKLGLDPLAGAEEADLGAASPKLGGDRHGGHDVSGGSPRRHHDSGRSCHRSIGSFHGRANARPRRRAVCQRRRSRRGRR